MFRAPELLKNPPFVCCFLLRKRSNYPRLRVFPTTALALSQRPTYFLPRSSRRELQNQPRGKTRFNEKGCCGKIKRDSSSSSTLAAGCQPGAQNFQHRRRPPRLKDCKQPRAKQKDLARVLRLKIPGILQFPQSRLNRCQVSTGTNRRHRRSCSGLSRCSFERSNTLSQPFQGISLVLNLRLLCPESQLQLVVTNLVRLLHRLELRNDATEHSAQLLPSLRLQRLKIRRLLIIVHLKPSLLRRWSIPSRISPW